MCSDRLQNGRSLRMRIEILWFFFKIKFLNFQKEAQEKIRQIVEKDESQSHQPSLPQKNKRRGLAKRKATWKTKSLNFQRLMMESQQGRCKLINFFFYFLKSGELKT